MWCGNSEAAPTTSPDWSIWSIICSVHQKHARKNWCVCLGDTIHPPIHICLKASALLSCQKKKKFQYKTCHNGQIRWKKWLFMQFLLAKSSSLVSRLLTTCNLPSRSRIWGRQAENMAASVHPPIPAECKHLKLALAGLAGGCDGHRLNVSALIFPLYLQWPDNVNPLMKPLCACPKPLSSGRAFPFSSRHMQPSLMRRSGNGHVSLCCFFFLSLFCSVIFVLTFGQFPTIYIGSLFFWTPAAIVELQNWRCASFYLFIFPMAGGNISEKNSGIFVLCWDQVMVRSLWF